MESEENDFNSMDQKTLDLFNQLNLKDLSSYPLFMNEIDLADNENEDVMGLRQMLEQEVVSLIQFIMIYLVGNCGREDWRLESSGK
jgi:hypothetical protein